MVTDLFIVQEKEKQMKRNIKLRKIDEKKRKNIQVQVHYNITGEYDIRLRSPVCSRVDKRVK